MSWRKGSRGRRTWSEEVVRRHTYTIRGSLSARDLAYSLDHNGEAREEIHMERSFLDRQAV